MLRYSLDMKLKGPHLAPPATERHKVWWDSLDSGGSTCHSECAVNWFSELSLSQLCQELKAREGSATHPDYYTSFLKTWVLFFFPWHMEVSKPRVEPMPQECQATAAATPDPYPAKLQGNSRTWLLWPSRWDGEWSAQDVGWSIWKPGQENHYADP